MRAPFAFTHGVGLGDCGVGSGPAPGVGNGATGIGICARSGQMRTHALANAHRCRWRRDVWQRDKLRQDRRTRHRLSGSVLQRTVGDAAQRRRSTHHLPLVGHFELVQLDVVGLNADVGRERLAGLELQPKLALCPIVVGRQTTSIIFTVVATSDGAAVVLETILARRKN